MNMKAIFTVMNTTTSFHYCLSSGQLTMKIAFIFKIAISVRNFKF